MPDDRQVQTAPEDRRWDELKFIQETVYKVWSAYLVYFLWFHTAIYAALSFAMGTGPKTPTRHAVLVSAFIIIVSELLSIIVSIALAVYSKRALRRTDAIVRDGNFHPGVDPRVLLPWQFLQVAAATCILSFIVSIGACLYVAFTGPS
jgi:magnesium-transporting ATPase (P-type)